jgi:flagellar biosynthetic protein FlhB
MADQEPGENRTEDPTPRRRQQAREEGRIAKSPELVSAAVLVTGAVLLASVAGRGLGRYAIGLFKTGPGWLVSMEQTSAGVVALVRSLTLRTAIAMVPFLVGIAVVALALGLLQTRGNASWKPLRPDLSRINPLNGFKKILGGEAILNLVKALLKLVVLAGMSYLILRSLWPRFVAANQGGAPMVAELLGHATFQVAFWIGGAFLLLGAFDYAVQFFRIEKTLKMSKQEIVQEHKEQEGDPQIKARVRQIARQRARQRMLSQVSKADVVITNPTHIAVALRYDATSGGAPVVLAMGERKLAERIKRIAAAAGVPMVENKPLARALLATGSVGAPIPPGLYVAVAEILAYVYRRRGRMPAGLTPARAGSR